jgi:UDP-N-acetylmuramate dehydrogenase
MSFEQKIQHNFSLAPYTTFHIGGTADYFTQVSSSNALLEAIQYAKENQLDFFVLGQGANILVGDKGFRGLVIKNEAKKVVITNETVTAESGITIKELIDTTAQLSLSGLEHFAGIPSSLGGALWQNLHFLSSDRTTTVFIADVLKSAQILTKNGEVKDVDNTFFNFAYDYSILHDTQDVVLSATLQLVPKAKEEIEKTIAANIAWRNEKHPENAVSCSAGSVFKKIEHHGAGRLIEKVGLKGKQIGGAQISDKHANFIINTGNATAKDVRDLISLAQTEVKKATGLDLQTEISFIGEF